MAKRVRTDADRKADRVYRDKHKPIQYGIQYKTDKIEGLRLQAYLDQTGQSANAYLKSLVKADLDHKGIAYPDPEEDNDIL